MKLMFSDGRAVEGTPLELAAFFLNLATQPGTSLPGRQTRVRRKRDGVAVPEYLIQQIRLGGTEGMAYRDLVTSYAERYPEKARTAAVNVSAQLSRLKAQGKVRKQGKRFFLAA